MASGAPGNRGLLGLVRELSRWWRSGRDFRQADPGDCVSNPAPTILLVDDDEDFRATIETVLRMAGFEVIAVGGWAPALAVLDTPQRVDLLITDIQMPGGVHGLALGRMALMRRPKLKIIYLTGFRFGAAVQEASGPILSKPVTADRLLEEIACQLGSAPEVASRKIA
jgi:DNA-binding NtrC family response regulator